MNIKDLEINIKQSIKLEKLEQLEELKQEKILEKSSWFFSVENIISGSKNKFISKKL